jgi:multisubunit Na+/H+ antiporter MnhF subunit
MNAWLWAATVLTAALVPLLAVAARAPRLCAVVALEAAGGDTVLVLLLLSEGTARQAFADLALILGVVSYLGAVAFLRFVERVR